jgi:hypothetical protein
MANAKQHHNNAHSKCLPLQPCQLDRNYINQNFIHSMVIKMSTKKTIADHLHHDLPNINNYPHDTLPNYRFITFSC